MTRYLWQSMILLLLVGRANAQETFIFPNTNRNAALANPAMQSMDSSTNFTASGRKQWTGINDAPQAFSFTASTFIKDPGLSAGLVVEHKSVAVNKYSGIGFMLSKTVKLSKTEYLSLGFYGGADNFSANYTSIGGGDPALAQKQRINQWRGIVGAGLLLHGERFYFGASMPRIPLKDYKDVPDESNGYLTAGILLPLNEQFSVAPNLAWNVLNKSRPVDAGAMLFVQETFGVGATYRSTGEVNAALQYSFQRTLQVGYSYIFAVGNSQNISRFSGGSHEVFINYRINNIPLPFKWW